MKHLIRIYLVFTGFFTDPDQGRLVFSPGLEVTIKTVVAHIDLAPFKPLDPCFNKVVLKDMFPFFEPVKFPGPLGPEFFRITDGPLIYLLVLPEALDCRFFLKLLWGKILLVLFPGKGFNQPAHCHLDLPWG